MINGAHVIIYSTDAEADRDFFRDVLGLTHVDVGGGWLIFGLPPSEVAVHPAGGGMDEDGEEAAGETNGNGHSAGNGGEDEEVEAGAEDEDFGEDEGEAEAEAEGETEGEEGGLEADAGEEEEVEDDDGGGAGGAEGGRHELYLMCDDIEAFVDKVGARNMECSPVQDQGWGLLTQLTLPGGGKLGVYQPRHARPATVTAGGAGRSAGGERKSAAKRPAKKAPAKAAKKVAKAAKKVARPAAKKKPAKKSRR